MLVVCMVPMAALISIFPVSFPYRMARITPAEGPHGRRLGRRGEAGRECSPGFRR